MTTIWQQASGRKGKASRNISLTAEEGYKNRCNVDKRIVNYTKEIKQITGGHEFAIGIPDRRTRKKLITGYYGGNS